ncbi:MAG: ankyrin repeat domain-containing protein [Phycisphaeraceae bacterium JB051]
MFDVVRFLVEHGANVNWPAEDGCCPLFYAALTWRADIFEYLLQQGADPNTRMGGNPELLFDWILFDYREEIYHAAEPEEPLDDEHIVDYLDRLSKKYDKPEPKILKLLKNAGAKRWRDLHPLENGDQNAGQKNS